jgi:hypothetical protein
MWGTKFQATGKIIVFYILILTFLDSRREDTRFWTAIAEFGLLLISSWIIFLIFFLRRPRLQRLTFRNLFDISQITRLFSVSDIEDRTEWWNKHHIT